MSDFIDFSTLKRPSSPNTYLIAPDGLCQNATPDGQAPVYEMTPSDLARAVRGAAEQQGAKQLEVSSNGLKLSYIDVTPLMRFKDDISVEILAAGAGQSTLAVYSRSRVGYSDLGKNAKRVRALLSALG